MTPSILHSSSISYLSSFALSPTSMAPSLQSLRHRHHHHPHSLLTRHRPDVPPAAFSSPFFLKPPTATATASAAPHSLSSSAASLSLSSSTPYTSPTLSFDQLELHLSTNNFRQADEETRRLLIALAGEPAQKRGYVYFSEVKFISADDLKAIDDLWRRYSDGKFGYSVQKRIFEKLNGDFTKLFMKLGWMKKLDTEIEQYNYRSFPTEFVWELNDDTPEGHLPLTNALRGTQLMTNILSHPAFEEIEEDGEIGEEITGNENGGVKESRDGSKSLRERMLNPDYSF